MEVSEERGCFDEDAARRVVLKNGANQQTIREGEEDEEEEEEEEEEELARACSRTP